MVPAVPDNPIPHTELQRRILVFRDALSEMDDDTQATVRNGVNHLAEALSSSSANMSPVLARIYAEAIMGAALCKWADSAALTSSIAHTHSLW